MMRTSVLAKDLMSRPVRQLTEATPVRDAAAFLLRHEISGAPVLDAHGRWVGVFTQNDLARCIQRRFSGPRPSRSLESREPVVDPFVQGPEEFGRTPVREFMTRGLFTVFPDATFDEVVQTMNTFKIHRVFVLDEKEGSLLGVITTMDVLRAIAPRKAARREQRKTRQA